MDGHSIPFKQEGELLVPENKKEWNEEDKRSIQLNAKAMHILFCALGPDEYSRVSSYSNTKNRRLNKGVEEEKVVKKKVGIALKSTTNEDSESSEELDEDKEMEMFARRLKRFMKSNKGRRFQKMEELKLESTKEKYHINCYDCKNQNKSSLIVINGRIRDQSNKSLKLMWILGVMRIPSMMKIKK
ncbi:hypothetical protein PVK06_047331 [Gossypium arboreum]|uniref:Uncharacterized protein n=1 Tax=Gossypium arboreum TaxID=29729 RepID=A0ABR0MDJ3_GOSAR|nr:hypothetical protein PVK06_047331 [Gossypium arboreum]